MPNPTMAEIEKRSREAERRGREGADMARPEPEPKRDDEVPVPFKTAR